jgi:hypothetical protein
MGASVHAEPAPFAQHPLGEPTALGDVGIDAD